MNLQAICYIWFLLRRIKEWIVIRRPFASFLFLPCFCIELIDQLFEDELRNWSKQVKLSLLQTILEESIRQLQHYFYLRFLTAEQLIDQGINCMKALVVLIPFCFSLAKYLIKQIFNFISLFYCFEYTFHSLNVLFDFAKISAVSSFTWPRRVWFDFKYDLPRQFSKVVANKSKFLFSNYEELFSIPNFYCSLYSYTLISQVLVRVLH